MMHENCAGCTREVQAVLDNRIRHFVISGVTYSGPRKFKDVPKPDRAVTVADHHRIGQKLVDLMNEFLRKIGAPPHCEFIIADTLQFYTDTHDPQELIGYIHVTLMQFFGARPLRYTHSMGNQRANVRETDGDHVWYPKGTFVYNDGLSLPPAPGHRKATDRATGDDLMAELEAVAASAKVNA